MTGDPNVPANKITFMADFDSFVPGGAVTNENVTPREEGEAPDLRPIVGFNVLTAPAVAVIDLQDRRVVGRFTRAVGQINRDPRKWAPEWDQCIVVLYERPKMTLYESDSVHTEVGLGVLFTDRGAGFRHMIEFSPLPLDDDVQPSWFHTQRQQA